MAKRDAGDGATQSLELEERFYARPADIFEVNLNTRHSETGCSQISGAGGVLLCTARCLRSAGRVILVLFILEVRATAKQKFICMF